VRGRGQRLYEARNISENYGDVIGCRHEVLPGLEVQSPMRLHVLVRGQRSRIVSAARDRSRSR
jgi:hypothetical protein